MVTFENVNNNLNKVFPINFGKSQYVPTSTETESPEGNVAALGTGKGPNEISSNGVYGSVEGTGQDGKHRLNMYM